MEAQQCAREPTGTNWPTLHETTKTQQPLKDCLQPLYKSHSTHTPQHTKKGGSGTTQASDHICGGHSSGETPGNIPNPEAKPTNANGTAPDRVWESRTPPQHNSNKPPLGPPLQEGVYHCAQTQSAKPKTVCTLTLNSPDSPTRTSPLFKVSFSQSSATRSDRRVDSRTMWHFLADYRRDPAMLS